jgi:phosphoribosylanthranilate isomerase
MKVKICGITREEDAWTAVQAGADALGFIFVRASKRWIEPERARAIITGLPPGVIPVGVFVNAPRQEIGNVVETAGIRLLQLHGEESPEDASGFGVPVWKGFRVRPGFDLRSLSGYAVNGFLLDNYVAGMYGGTGRTFDWETAIAAKKYGPIILSGGITPDNVVEAMRRVAPYAIDVNSGVESAPGVKDADKIHRLFEAVRKKKESLC